MAANSFLLHHISRLVAPSEPDAVLLQRFIHQRDEAAFTALVKRHGSLVHHVCRRLLADAHIAEDAFQATFLVLARRARTIRRPASLAAWLHGVAHHMALKARRMEHRRQQSEANGVDRGSPDPRPDPLAEVSAREVLVILDEEVARLPEAFRLPILLCGLEGLGLEEAARRLGWTRDSVKGRLERGRKRLHERLVKRGLTLTAALAAAEMARGSVTAGLVHALAHSTTRSALLFLSGPMVPTEISAQVAPLAEGALKAALLAKLKGAVALVLALSVLVVGAGLAAYQVLEGKPPNTKAVSKPERGIPSVQPTDRPATGETSRVRNDVYGDPLPPGAVARVGSMRRWRGRNNYGSPLVFTPDGKKVVFCENGQAIRFLNTATGQDVRRICPNRDVVNSKDQMTTFALAPDGKTLITAGLWNPKLRLWDVGTGKELRQLPGASNGTNTVAFSSDGKMFAAAGSAEGKAVITLWDATTWQETRQITGLPEWIGSISFVPGGKTLISGGGLCRNICWWDVGTGREIRRLAIKSEHSWELVISPDGKRLAAYMTSGDLYLFNGATGEEVSRTGFGPEHPVGCLCFSPDSQALACGHSGDRILFYSAATGREQYRWDQEGYPAHMAFSPNGKVLALSDRQIIRFRDSRTGQRVGPELGLPDYVMLVRFAQDGQTLLAGCWGGKIGFWDPLTGKSQAPFRDPPKGFARRARMLLGTALSADGRKAALVDAEGTLHLWEPVTGKVLCRIDKPPVREDQANFSPDGNTVVIKHKDDVIRLWDIATGHLRCSLPKSEYFSPHPHVFSPDGRVLATREGGGLDRAVIRLWDTATGEKRGELTWPGRRIPECLAFSTDGKSLFAALGRNMGPSGSDEQPSVFLWDLTSRRRVREFPVPAGAGWMWSLAISSDGKTLAAAVYDRIVLWELASGQERGRYPGHRDWVRSLAFSPDGRLLASGSMDYTALVWDVTGRCPDGRWTVRNARPEELERLWADLAGKEGTRAFRALWGLAALGRQSVPFLAERLRPVQVDKDRLARWIADLDAGDYEVREKAQRELESLGEAAEGAVRKALEGPLSPEAHRQAEAIVQGLLGRSCSPEQLQTLRAVEVLEHVGTPESQNVLRSLAGGAAGARLTEEAKTSLQRLKQRAAKL